MKMENTGMYFEKILFERNTIPILKGSLFGQILFDRKYWPGNLWRLLWLFTNMPNLGDYVG